MRAITFEYSGIARQELESSREIGANARVDEHRFVRVPDLKEAGDIQGLDLGTLPASYIPSRNIIFYSFAANFAEITGARAIVGGHNSDDSLIFSDVSDTFFRGLQRVLREGSPILRKRRLRILRPLKEMKKAEVVRLAVKLRVPLGQTWSCHRDGKEHCWKCSGCRSRVASFAEAGVEDPLRHIRREKIT